VSAAQTPFALRAPGIDEDDRLLAFHGVEAVSAPYRYAVTVLIRGAGVDALIGAIGEAASLVRVDTDESSPVHGVIAEVDLLQEEKDWAVVEVVIRPRWWRLSLTQHSRVFTDTSTDQVLERLLTEHDVPHRLELSGTYEQRDHRCQYRESDLAFLSRWMERDGIFYYFEHGDDTETLVIADEGRSFAKPTGEPIPYRPASIRDRSAASAFSLFRPRARLTTGVVTLRDYDYVKPKHAVRGEREVPNLAREATVDHLLNVRAPGEATRLAEVAAQRASSAAQRYAGHGQIAGLRSGHQFSLSEHPRDAVNGDYVVLELEIFGNYTSGDGFVDLLDLPFEDELRVDVEAARADAPFRAATTTPWPRVYGVENAIVDGPAESPYAQIDERGRYKLRILFDEGDNAEGSASTWVRMAQPHGGSNEGFHFPLRKGTEVMLSFLGGDPDQPVISGVLPNEVTPSPVTNTNAMENVIRTGALNEMVMGDEAGKEFVHLATPHKATSIHMGDPAAEHHLEVLTDGHAHTAIGGRLDEEIVGDKVQQVQGVVEKTHQSDELKTVFGSASYSIGEDKASLTMNNEASVTIGNRASTTLANSVSFTAGNSFSRTMGMTVSEFVGVKVSNSLSDSFTNTAGNSFTTVTGNSFTQTVGTSTSLFVGASNSSFIGDQASFFFGNKASTSIGTNTSITIAAETNMALASRNYLTIGTNTGISLAMNTAINAAVKMELNAAIELSLTAALGVAFKIGKVEEVPLKSETTKVDILEKKLEVMSGEMAVLAHSMMMLGK